MTLDDVIGISGDDEDDDVKVDVHVDDVKENVENPSSGIEDDQAPISDEDSEKNQVTINTCT